MEFITYTIPSAQYLFRHRMYKTTVRLHCQQQVNIKGIRDTVVDGIYSIASVLEAFAWKTGSVSICIQMDFGGFYEKAQRGSQRIRLPGQ